MEVIAASGNPFEIDFPPRNLCSFFFSFHKSISMQSDELTSEQHDSLDLLNRILSIIGLVFCSSCLVMIYLLGLFRKTEHKLILPIVLAFFFETGSVAVSSFSRFGRTDSGPCTAVAFVVQLSTLVGIYFVLLFAVHLERKIVRKKRHTGRALPLMHWFAWTFAAFNSFLPLTTSGYGLEPGYFCWISQHKWTLITYTVPLILFFIAVAILYALILRSLLRRSRSGILRTLQRSLILFSFPFFFILLRTAGVVNQATVFATGERSYGLYFWNYLSNGLLPIFFSIIYLYAFLLLPSSLSFSFSLTASLSLFLSSVELSTTLTVFSKYRRDTGVLRLRSKSLSEAPPNKSFILFNKLNRTNQLSQIFY